MVKRPGKPAKKSGKKKKENNLARTQEEKEHGEAGESFVAEQLPVSP